MQIEHKKNTAYYLAFPAVDSTSPESFKTGVSPVDTAYYKDGAGAWTSLAITDTAAEIGATGVYEIDLTAAEMNHDQVIIKFAVSGMADTAFMFDMRTKLVSDLNDVASTDIVSAGAITTSSGAVNTVTTVTNQHTLAEINAEVDTALTDIHLDHLMAVAAADVVVDGSVIAHMVSTTEDWSTFVPSTDSLQAVRDWVGDGANLSEAGGTGDHLTAITGVQLAADQAVNVTKINGNAAAAVNLALSTGQIIVGTATGDLTDTTFSDSALSETTVDHYKGRIIIWTSGVLAGQATDITGYSAGKVFTFTQVTDTVGSGDSYIIV
jgi:cytidylate kinase